jgi:hypothetical protein
MTVKWLDHPSLGANKPLVLMDKLNALKPALVDKIQKVLRKMPAYIRDIVNPRDFPDLPALTDQCNKIWEVGARMSGPPPP